MQYESNNHAKLNDLIKQILIVLILLDHGG